MADADLESATIELKNALLKDSKNSEARRLLGLIYFESARYEEAEKELALAMEGGAASETVVPVYAQVLLALGRHEKLQSLSGEGLGPESMSTVLAARSLSLLSQDRVDQSREYIGEALSQSRVSPFALVADAQVAMAGSTPDVYAAAREKLDSALARTTGYAPAWSLLGDVQSQQGRFDEAVAAYSKAIELSKNRIDDRLKRAIVRILDGEIPAAREDVAYLRKAAPGHSTVLFIQGLLHFQQKEFDSALAAFESAVQGGRSPFALYYMAAIHAHNQNFLLARNYLKQFLAFAPSSPTGLKLMAYLDYRDGSYGSAEKWARQASLVSPGDSHALNLLANAIMAQDGRNDEAMRILLQIAELEPESAQARLRIGSVYLATGEHELAEEYLKSSLLLNPQNRNTEILQIYNYLAEQDFDAAIEAAENYRDRHPGEITPLALLGRAYLAANKIEEAKKTLHHILSISPSNTNASHTLAFIALLEDDPGGVEHYLRGILQHDPDNLRALLKLAALAALEGRQAAMIESLQQAIEKHPAAVEPRQVLARYYLGENQPRKAMAILEALEEDVRGSPRVLGTLVRAELADEQFQRALTSARQLVARAPDVADNHYLVAMAEAGAKQLKGMRRSLEDAVALDPDHLPSRLALARLGLLTRDNDLFHVQLESLKRIDPDHPDIPYLEAALLARAGDFANAVEKLEEVFARHPTTKNMLTLAQQYRRAGDAQKAESLMSDWLEQHPEDIPGRMALSRYYAANNNVEKANREYREILRRDGGNVIALNNLAWNLRGSDPGEALSYAEKARELAPEDPKVLDTLAMTLLENKKLREARAAIDMALKLDPENRRIRYHRALVTLAEGDKSGARKILDPLLREEGNFPEKADARALLEQLKNETVPEEED